MKIQALIFILFTYCIISNNLCAQTETEVPTLQIGLDGLSLNQGVLDPMIVAEIIAEKQEEIKVKLIKSMLLNRLDEAGGTFYLFADNIISNIAKEKNADLRTRRIIESGVNLAFTVAFAEYYVASANTILNTELVNFSRDRGNTITTPNPSNFNELFNNGPNPNYLDNANKTRAKEEQIIFDNTSMGILIDMASEAIRQNNKIRKLGILRLSYEGSYYSLNSFLQLETRDPGYSEAQIIYSDMCAKLDQMMNHVGLIELIVDELLINKNNYTNLQSTISGLMTLSPGTRKSKLKSVNSKIEGVLKKIESLPDYPDKKTDLLRLIESYEQINTILLNNSINTSTLPSEWADVIFTLKDVVIGSINNVSYKDAAVTTVVTTLQEVYISIAQSLIQEAIANEVFQNNGKLFNIHQLIAKIYEFDKASSYTDFFNVLSDVGDIFPNVKIRSTINTVVSFVKDYTIIKVDDQKNEEIHFNIESFLVKLKNLRYNKNRPFEFNFTVGAQSANFDSPLLVNTELIENYTYVGEKIGLKIKLYDWAYTRSFNKNERFKYWNKYYTRLQPPKEPTISNIHLSLTGTGILYSLANTGTTNDFNEPLMAVGFGLSFFNNLDVNICRGIPILPGEGFNLKSDHAFWQFGFDIPFVEYLDRLNKKRKDRKQQELLIEANKNSKT